MVKCANCGAETDDPKYSDCFPGPLCYICWLIYEVESEPE